MSLFKKRNTVTPSQRTDYTLNGSQPSYPQFQNPQFINPPFQNSQFQGPLPIIMFPMSPDMKSDGRSHVQSVRPSYPLFIPQFAQRPPQFGQQPPQFGQQPPQFGQQPPQFSQQLPPQFGQLLPQFGQQPPQFGQLPLQFGQQLPQFGQQLPPQFVPQLIPQLPPQYSSQIPSPPQFGSQLSSQFGQPYFRQSNPQVSFPILQTSSFPFSKNHLFRLTTGWPGITCPPKTTPNENARISLLTGLNPDTVETLANEFSLLTSGSGKLDKPKFETILLKTIYGPQIVTANRFASSLFSSYDSNSSGVIEFPEFVSAYKKMLTENDMQSIL